MNKLLLAIILLSILAISGCVSQTTVGSGIAVKSQLDPSRMYSDSVSTLYIDLENQDISPIDASVEVFDTGLLAIAGDECKASYENMLPKEIKTTEYQLKAPSAESLSSPTTSTNIDYKVVFR